MSKRLRAIWQESRTAFEAERYTLDDGTEVDLGAPLAEMRNGTRLYDPEGAADLPSTAGRFATRFEVTGESTLAATMRLADGVEGSGRAVAALNFASARKPGGGVANGAQAQEESLARSSALYDSLTRCPEFYEYHRQHESLLYSDRVIYSPSVPVFRDDRGRWLRRPVPIAFLTSAAPNRRMMERNQSEPTGSIPAVLRARARAVLAVAAAEGADRLVLGAWGCGVFGNHPPEVAAAFAEHLLEGGEFAGAFAQVAFAVLDREEAVRGAFQQYF